MIIGSMEKFLPNGNGSVRAWIQTVPGLETWEKGLILGDAYFQTTAKSQLARARFTLGLLCLHLFQYTQAFDFFERAQKDEQLFSGRKYPMAMWGAAMTTKQMLWRASNCTEGKSYLKNMTDNVYWISDKERDFIETGNELYPSNMDCNKDNEYDREERFMKSMKKVMEKYPKEVEAGLFYGVSKLATLSHDDCNDTCKPEGDVLRNQLHEMIKTHPTHPGSLHYTIHAFDVHALFKKGTEKFVDKMIPPHEQKNHEAQIAINASDDLLYIAKSSCHGRHMPSHIYLRLGEFRLSLNSNNLSMQVSFFKFQLLYSI